LKIQDNCTTNIGTTKDRFLRGASHERSILRHVTSLGHHRRGEEFSERGPNFSNYVRFQIMSNTYFQGAKSDLGGLAPLVTGLGILSRFSDKRSNRSHLREAPKTKMA